MALKMYIAEHLTDDDCSDETHVSEESIVLSDLSGLFISQSTVLNIVEGILNGDIDDTATLSKTVNSTILNKEDIEKKLALKVANDTYGWLSLDLEDRQNLIARCKKARGEWLSMIAKDAEKEYELGDVDRETVDKFLNSTY